MLRVGEPVLCIAHFLEQPSQYPSTFWGTCSPSILHFSALTHTVTPVFGTLCPSACLFDHWNWILFYQPSQVTFSQANSLVILAMCHALSHSQISRTDRHTPGAGKAHLLLPPHIVNRVGCQWQPGLQRLLPPSSPQDLYPCPTSILECQGLSLTCESPGNGSGAGRLMSRTRPEPRCNMLDERESREDGLEDFPQPSDPYTSL